MHGWLWQLKEQVLALQDLLAEPPFTHSILGTQWWSVKNKSATVCRNNRERDQTWKISLYKTSLRSKHKNWICRPLWPLRSVSWLQKSYLKKLKVLWKGRRMLWIRRALDSSRKTLRTFSLWIPEWDRFWSLHAIQKEICLYSQIIQQLPHIRWLSFLRVRIHLLYLKLIIK